MKASRPSQPECQRVGIRSIAPLDFILFRVMDVLFKCGMERRKRLLCLANNKPSFPKLIEIYLNPRLAWSAIAYRTKYIGVSMSVVLCDLGWKCGHLLMLLSPAYRDAFHRENVIYELKGWENMSPDRLKAEKVRELLAAGVNPDAVDCDGLLLCVRDAYAGGWRTTEYVSIGGNWIERLVKGDAAGNPFENPNNRKNDRPFEDGHILSANVKVDVPGTAGTSLRKE